MPGQGEERGVVGDEAGGEDERGVLVVQLGQLALELLVERRVARDVAGAAGAHAVHLGRVGNGLLDLENNLLYASAKKRSKMYFLLRS